MSEVRQILKNKGWKQGVILKPVQPGKDVFACLVLNQTCDLINPDFVKEPHLELLPLVKVIGNPDSRLKHGKNPRQIHFQIQEGGRDVWVNAKITEIFQFKRAEHELLEFATDCSLPSNILDDLIYWRAQRYLRPAFPDAFELAFNPLAEKFASIILEHESNIESLLISLDPLREITKGEFYEIQLHLMISPTLAGQPGVVNGLKDAARKIQGVLGGSPSFDSPRCQVTELTEMSLWKARKFLDFSRYDYLSFGKED